MPVASWSRAAVDAEIERIRQCVIPVIGVDKRLRPCLIGSAVALVYRSRKILVTAHHVLADNLKVPLSIFGADGLRRPLQKGFLSSIPHDLAAKLLSDQEIEILSHIPFLPHDEISRVSTVGERFYGSVVGYPATSARRMDRITLDTRMEAYSNFAWESIDGRIAVAFDKKDGAVGEDRHVDPRDPFGKSGGAIFGMPVHGSNIVPQQSAKLVAISSRWKRDQKFIQGASIALLLPLLDKLILRDREATL